MDRFEPEVVLNRSEQASLASLLGMPGYRIMHRLYRAEVDKFILHLINADERDSAGVIASHLLAKAAAQFYTAITSRVNEEVMQYTGAPQPGDKPQDVTEGILDIGDYTQGHYTQFDELDSSDFELREFGGIGE